jgi:hypothetical protein
VNPSNAGMAEQAYLVALRERKTVIGIIPENGGTLSLYLISLLNSCLAKTYVIIHLMSITVLIGSVKNVAVSIMLNKLGLEILKILALCSYGLGTVSRKTKRAVNNIFIILKNDACNHSYNEPESKVDGKHRPERSL